MYQCLRITCQEPHNLKYVDNFIEQMIFYDTYHNQKAKEICAGIKNVLAIDRKLGG